MNSTDKINDVIKEALKLVTPSQAEVNAINDASNSIIKLLNDALRKLNLNAEVTLQGSVAHGTWLPGDRDIDVFIVFPREERYIQMVKSGEIIKELSKVVSEVGISWVMNYAQHPYLTLTYSGFNIDVVPCIRINIGEKPITAADRTPLHTLYLRDKLRGLEDEVKLLKLMMKAIGVYGAEVKVQGFSGYLTELLVIAYGGFLNTLKAASRWVPFRVRINLGVPSKAMFNSPLVVIDPVDPNRNVAAAVSLDSMSIFIAAARWFLRKPSIFFFIKEATTPKPRLITHTLVIYGEYPKGQVEDVVWGQLRSIASSIWNIIRKDGFRPIDIGLYTPNDKYVAIMITVEEPELPIYERHIGPPVWTDEADSFIDKYINAEDVVGPFVRNGRWVVIRARKIRSIKDSALRGIRMLRDNPVKESLIRGNIMLVSDLNQLNELPSELREAVLAFMNKRPRWLVN